MIPHGIAFGEALERAFVEAVITQGKPQDPRAPVEVQVDYATVVNCRSVNLSRSGIFIRTAHRLPVNRTLSLRFSLQGIPTPLQVRGRVIWSNPNARRSYPHGMEVKFVGLPRERAGQIQASPAQGVGRERIAELLVSPWKIRGRRHPRGAPARARGGTATGRLKRPMSTTGGQPCG